MRSPLPVSIIHKGSHRRAADTNQTVVTVITDVAGLPADGTGCHVAIGVIRIRVPIREGGHGVFVGGVSVGEAHTGFAGTVAGGGANHVISFITV